MTAVAIPRLPWPLPALVAWLAAWAAFAATASVSAAGRGPLAFTVGAAVGCALAATATGRWRQAIAAGGFPLSALALGALPGMPGWAWLAAAVPLLLAYPLRAWRDAPFFPTPAHALDDLAAVVPLADGARVLDAGCGMGHGLRALRRAWPGAALEGVEWSRPLAWLAARRCGFAQVRRGDMWAGSWAGCAVVYVFQRPESMARVAAKADAEMAPGSWLVSLEFAVPGRAASARCGAPGARPVWIYRIGAPRDKRSTGTRRRR